MKFSFSPLVILTVLFTFAFAAPTERALFKRALDFRFGNFNFGNTGVAVRDVVPTLGEHHLNKRSVIIPLEINILNTGLPFKRGTEGGDGELFKRSEVYRVIVTSLPPLNKITSRSTDAYAGRNVLVTIPDSMVQALEQMGLSQQNLPQYMSEHLAATDPATSESYGFKPAVDYTPSVDDISLIMDYQPTGM